MRYLFLASAVICFGCGYVIAVYSIQQLYAGDITKLVPLVMSVPLIVWSRAWYWKYEKPSVDAWLG